MITIEATGVFSLGRQGENGYRQITFDLTDLLDGMDLTGAEVVCLLERPHSAPIICNEFTYDLTEKTAVLTVTSAETSMSGRCRLELDLVIGEKVGKTQIFACNVLPALGEPTTCTGDIPWVSEVLEASEQAQASAQSASASAQEAQEIADELADTIGTAVEEYLEEHPITAPVTSVNGDTGDVVITAADLGALTVELDPVFGASAAAGITSADITAWNGKYTKPSGGVPVSDLNSTAQSRLMPTGGTTGQVLAKKSNSNYDTEWVNQSGGGGAVDSVNGKTGTVVLDASDVGALPSSTTASDLGAYVKPSGGIPKTDLASAVQTSLGKADNVTQLQTEVQNARVGVDGTTYDTLGNAIRGQVSDLKSAINDIAVNGEYVSLNNANILPDPQMNKGLWGQAQGSMTVTTKSGSLSNVINYTRTGSSSGTLGIVVPISLLEDGKTYRFHIRSDDAHRPPIRIRDNNNGTYGNVNKYLVSDQSMTHTDGDKYHYYDWTFDASELTSGYQYVQIDLKLTAESSTTYHFYEPFLGLANGDLAYEKTYYIGKYDEILEPTNLFNGNYYANSYWNSNGVLTSANKYCCAKPQLLGAGNYIFIVCKQYYGSGAGTVYVFSSASSTTMTEKFSATLLEERTVNGLTCALYTFSLSEDKYIATNIGYEGFEADDYMIVRGSTIADYPASYRYYFEPYSVVKEPTKLNESMVEQTNPIYGKKVAVNGDSICAGAGANGGFIKPIAGRNNMDSTNIGVSGGTIAYGTTYDGGANRHWICTTIQNMPSGCDYYIFEGGVNDYANNVPVGSLTTGFPVKGSADDNIDNTTITGAMEYACRDLVTLFAGKKCGFVFVHGIYGLTGSYANWHTQFKPAMISALKKWGVPYIDLEEEVPPLNLIPSLKSVYTADGDGWHPNKAGYAAFYTDKIEAWMKTL